jgi:hypothetical protein
MGVQGNVNGGSVALDGFRIVMPGNMLHPVPDSETDLDDSTDEEGLETLHRPSQGSQFCRNVCYGLAMGAVVGGCYASVAQLAFSKIVTAISSIGCGSATCLTVTFRDKITRCFSKYCYCCKRREPNPNPGPEGKV